MLLAECSCASLWLDQGIPFMQDEGLVLHVPGIHFGTEVRWRSCVGFDQSETGGS